MRKDWPVKAQACGFSACLRSPEGTVCLLEEIRPAGTLESSNVGLLPRLQQESFALP
jgi:hypothetical protein